MECGIADGGPGVGGDPWACGVHVARPDEECGRCFERVRMEGSSWLVDILIRYAMIRAM